MPKRTRPDVAIRRPVYIYVSHGYGAIELRGPRWEVAWDSKHKLAPGSRMKRLELPPNIAAPLELFLEQMHRGGYYVRSIEVFRPHVADRIEALLKAAKKAGAD